MNQMTESCDTGVNNLEEEIEKLCKQLVEHYDAGNEEEMKGLLETIITSLEEQSEIRMQYLDFACLPLSAPCMIAGSLSAQCSEQASRVLLEMSSHGPSKEVFAGLTDGVSTVLEDPTIDFTSMLSPVLQSMRNSVVRISRKKEKFVSISLRLILRLLERLEETIYESDLSKVDISQVISICHSFLTISEDKQPTKEAFSLLVTGVCLSLLLWSVDLEKSFLASETNICSKIKKLCSKMDMQGWFEGDENLMLLAKSWIEEEEDSEPDQESKLVHKLKKACGLLCWANQKYSLELSGISSRTPELFSWMSYLFGVEPTERNSPYVMAGLDIVLVCLEKEDSWDSDWLTVCLSIVSLMTEHPVISLKLKSHATFQLIVSKSPEDVKWTILSTLVFTSSDEVAALIVQSIRSTVVDAFDKEKFGSVFTSNEVVQLMDKLIKACRSEQKWSRKRLIAKAATLTAVLNLFVFLVVRESRSKTNHTRICNERNISSLNQMLMDMREASGPSTLLQNQEAEASLEVQENLALHTLFLSIETLSETLTRV